MDRKVVAVMDKMREKHRFLRGMSTWVGFKQIGVEYKRHARFAGETKYPLKKMIQLALNAITSFSYFPLQLATYLGFICAGLAVIAIPVVAILRLTTGTVLLGQATTLTIVLFLGGVQLISLGSSVNTSAGSMMEAKAPALYRRRSPGGHGKSGSLNEPSLNQISPKSQNTILKKEDIIDM